MQTPEKQFPLSRHALYELSLFSTLLLILAALAVQFCITLQTSLLLKLFSISFKYTLFAIIYPGMSMEHWSIARILVVFGLGYLVWFFAGFLLLRIKTENWKLNLALTWLAFILINGLPLQMFAGAFFYTGFGIAYTWLFHYFAIRVSLAVLAIGIMVWFRPFWISRFLQTAYSRAFLTDESHSKKFITYGVMFPWYFGILLLLPFGISGNSWIWIICLAGLGIVVLPIFNKMVPFEYIAYKSGKHIFTTKYPLPLVIAIVAALWLLSWLTVRF